MLKDRGSKKWTSLMLVEHKRKLKQLEKNKNNIEKPELSEDKLQELDYLLEKAIAKNLTVLMKYYKNQEYQNIQGKIKSVQNNTIHLKNQNTLYKLKPENVIEIKILQ